jgi:hypothetical protein
MNNVRKGLYAAVLSLGLSGFAARAQQSDLQVRIDAADAADPVSQPLSGIVVTGNGNPFLRSDQRLAMLNASLPLGADNGAVQSSYLERVAALFPHSPEAAGGEARRMMERGHTLPAGSDPDGDIALGGR